jgi:anaerobic magnesium-protoporphyrin IX monomethyl ester cyclase
MAGGPLLDAGHEVHLLDAECGRLTPAAVLCAVRRLCPNLVMTGHAGSTPAHPVCVELLRVIKAAFPEVVVVYGGVYPTYHAREILTRERHIDFIVRGEGEATVSELVATLSKTLRAETLPDSEMASLERIQGLAFRMGDHVVLTDERPPIRDLNCYRVGWELIQDWSAYQCFGLGRAAIVQFSRGCPHRCTYCGQHGFWVQWRHRDPVRLADEIEWLHRAHNVRFITLADENPTTLRDVWRRFLEELAARRLPVHLFATIRATDIVRDADLLPLYRKAGILYILMGIESTDGDVLQKIHKDSTPRDDFHACRLLKEHDIFSILGHIVGFEDETWETFRRALRHLRAYDGDWLNAMYITPHSWTPFGREVKHRRVVECDQRKWDYRHQVLGQKHLTPWQLFAAVKWLEFRFHVRPLRLWELLRSRDRLRRRQLLWTYFHIGLVWLGEIAEFCVEVIRKRRLRRQNSLAVDSWPEDLPVRSHAATPCK